MDSRLNPTTYMDTGDPKTPSGALGKVIEDDLNSDENGFLRSEIEKDIYG